VFFAVKHSRKFILLAERDDNCIGASGVINHRERKGCRVVTCSGVAEHGLAGGLVCRRVLNYILLTMLFSG